MWVFRNIAAISLCLLASLAAADDLASVPPHAKISGAFGLNLGDTIEPKADGTLSLSGYKTTQFVGKESSGLFTTFFSAVTPETKKVAAIAAMSEGSADDARCESSAAQLARALVKQYGPNVENIINVEAFRRGDLYVWRSGDVEVQLACRSYGIMEPFYVQIFYTDKKLMEDFKSENFALEQGEVNLSDFVGTEKNADSIGANTAKVDVDKVIEGPLGFSWGSAVEAAPVKFESQIELAREQAIFDEAMQYNCRGEIIGDMSAQEFGASYSTLLKTDDSAKQSQYYLNEAEADVSQGGRVSAYLFKVEFSGKNIYTCGAYFDNKLFMLQFYYEDLAKVDLYDLFLAGLNKQYGEVKSACFFGTCIGNWLDHDKKVQITSVVIDDITYQYAPVKLEQLRAWIDLYDTKVSGKLGESKL